MRLPILLITAFIVVSFSHPNVKFTRAQCSNLGVKPQQEPTGRNYKFGVYRIDGFKKHIEVQHHSISETRIIIKTFTDFGGTCSPREVEYKRVVVIPNNYSIKRGNGDFKKSTSKACNNDAKLKFVDIDCPSNKKFNILGTKRVNKSHRFSCDDHEFGDYSFFKNGSREVCYLTTKKEVECFVCKEKSCM